MSSQSSRKFLASNNIDIDNIFNGCYTISASSFIPRLPKKSHIISSRDPNSFLFVGKLIPERNILATISSFYSIDIEGSTLYVIGDGPDFASAQELVENNIHKSCTVVLLGSLPFDQIHQNFILCANYVNFGSEPYSTALELAAFYGMNISSSLNCGFMHDLVYFRGDPVLNDYSLKSFYSSYKRLHQMSLISSYSTSNCSSALLRRDHSLCQFDSLVRFLGF